MSHDNKSYSAVTHETFRKLKWYIFYQLFIDQAWHQMIFIFLCIEKLFGLKKLINEDKLKSDSEIKKEKTDEKCL